MKRAIFVALLLLLLAACTPQVLEEEPQAVASQAPDVVWVLTDASARYGAYRFIDHQAGVVCWVYANYGKGGISCLPLIETRLPNE